MMDSGLCFNQGALLRRLWGGASLWLGVNILLGFSFCLPVSPALSYLLLAQASFHDIMGHPYLSDCFDSVLIQPFRFKFYSRVRFRMSVLQRISTCDLKGLEARQDGLQSPSYIPVLCSRGAPRVQSARRDWEESITFHHVTEGGPGLTLADSLLVTSHWSCLYLSLMWKFRHWLDQLVPAQLRSRAAYPTVSVVGCQQNVASLAASTEV